MAKKKLFTADYEIHASIKMLYPYIESASGVDFREHRLMGISHWSLSHWGLSYSYYWVMVVSHRNLINRRCVLMTKSINPRQPLLNFQRVHPKDLSAPHDHQNWNNQ